ncbi:trihelix transcription factor ASIL2-like [Aristolochia californica]|uniref:trihelix transcription factor ASIL2-like n=1 Tax=Aristolochia californica TaxID=171875 RepID=UPI0035DB90E1
MEDDSNEEEEQEHEEEHNQDYDLDEEDEDNENDGISHQPPPIAVSSLPPASRPVPPTVTLAAPAPTSHKNLTLALPIQNPRPPGGGREDCWSEGATDTLIDAWGDRYLHLSRGNLKHNHWQEVADAVTSRENYRKTPKTDVQCKNRIDTLKKKYKVEKAKIGSCGGLSNWIFFQKLDRLIGGPTATPKPPALPPPQPPLAKLPVTVPTRARSVRQHHANSEDSSDSFPPVMVNGKKRRLGKEGDREVGDSLRELTRAIERFGELYERAERAKLKQVTEMEKQRMSFLRELELQRMQFYMKTQMEISSLHS